MHEGHDPDEGAEHERFWSEHYKEVIRSLVAPKIVGDLLRAEAFAGLYRERYAGRFRTYEEFARRIGEMVAIGAENGVDDAFDEVNRAFLAERSLPYSRAYAAYNWPESLDEEARRGLHAAIAQEYGDDRVWRSIYEEHYTARYPSFADLLEQVADLAVLGAINGADDVIGEIYKSFIDARALPPVRRYPKRLRAW